MVIARKKSNSKENPKKRSKRTPTSPVASPYDSQRILCNLSNNSNKEMGRPTKNSQKAGGGTPEDDTSKTENPPVAANLLQALQVIQASGLSLGAPTPGVAAAASLPTSNAALLEALNSATAKRKLATPDDDSSDLKAQMKNDSARRKAKQAKKNAPKEMNALITSTVKAQLWKGVKIPYGTNQQEKAAEMCLDAMNLEGFQGNSPKEKEDRAEWILTYMPKVTTAINNQRSYVQKQIQKSCFKWMDSHSGKMPEMSKLLACMERKVDITKGNGWEYALFYWDELIPHAVGNRHDWNEAKRYYFTMSKAAPPNKPDKPYVTPSTEAFALACIESNHTRWAAVRAKQLENPGRNYSVKSKYEKDEPEETQSKDKKTWYLNGEKYMSKYTNPLQGQDPNPGWTKQGRDRFKELCKLSKEAREKPTSLTKEEEILNKLREVNGIEGKTIEEERKLKRRSDNSKKAAMELEEEEDDFDEI